MARGRPASRHRVPCAVTPSGSPEGLFLRKPVDPWTSSLAAPVPCHECPVSLLNPSKIKPVEARELTGTTCTWGTMACSRQQCRTHGRKDRCRTQREESPARGAPVLTLRRSPRRVRGSLRSRRHGNRCAPASNGARTGEGRCFPAQERIQPVSREARSSHHPWSTSRSRDEAGTSRQNQRRHQRTSGHLRSTARRWKQSPPSQPFPLACMLTGLYGAKRALGSVPATTAFQQASASHPHACFRRQRAFRTSVWGSAPNVEVMPGSPPAASASARCASQALLGPSPSPDSPGSAGRCPRTGARPGPEQRATPPGAFRRSPASRY